MDRSFAAPGAAARHADCAACGQRTVERCKICGRPICEQCMPGPGHGMPPCCRGRKGE